MIRAEKVIHSPQGIMGVRLPAGFNFLPFFFSVILLLFSLFCFVLYFVTIFCLLAGFYIASPHPPHHSFTRCCDKLISTKPNNGYTSCRVVDLSTFQVKISSCRDFKMSRCTGQDVDMLNCRVDLLKKNADTAGSN